MKFFYRYLALQQFSRAIKKFAIHSQRKPINLIFRTPPPSHFDIFHVSIDLLLQSYIRSAECTHINAHIWDRIFFKGDDGKIDQF